mmetsp:Transcript_116081/g.329000  ORF Transcript_116081/g.329000 Transcript_116081/m.329000 type:complete len:249 (-) Transcript_116081:288-1034(-)
MWEGSPRVPPPSPLAWGRAWGRAWLGHPLSAGLIFHHGEAPHLVGEGCGELVFCEERLQLRRRHLAKNIWEDAVHHLARPLVGRGRAVRHRPAHTGFEALMRLAARVPRARCRDIEKEALRGRAEPRGVPRAPRGLRVGLAEPLRKLVEHHRVWPWKAAGRVLAHEDMCIACALVEVGVVFDLGESDPGVHCVLKIQTPLRHLYRQILVQRALAEKAGDDPLLDGVAPKRGPPGRFEVGGEDGVGLSA